MELIKLKFIKADPDQPRQQFEPSQMESLEKSIKEKGILMPLIVERMDNDKYLVIDGERRYRTAVKLKLEEVPVEIMESMNPVERMITRFHIQEQHQSWTVFDKARAIYFFMKEEKLTYQQVAEMLGMSKDTVHHWVGILELSKKSQIKAVERRIPFSYLFSIVKISRKYSEISEFKIPEIEEIILNKIETKKMMSGDLKILIKFLSSSGNDEKKIKFLKNDNYTVLNMIDSTPEGKSIQIDSAIFYVISLTSKLRKVIQYKSQATDRQLMILENLKKEIENFIK